MKFIFSENDEFLCGDLVYRESEYSIDFTCSSSKQLEFKTGDQGCMSLTAGTLQLEVGVESREILYPWGFFPIMNIEARAIEVPISKGGSIIVDPEGFDLIEGVSWDIPGSNSWKIIREQDGGWIYIGPDKVLFDKGSYVEFASGAILGLKDGDISCIFIRPRFIRE